MKRGWNRWVAGLAVGLLATAVMAVEDESLLGISADRLREVRGHPDRAIPTGEGELLFYGGTLLYALNDEIVFISTGGDAVLRERKPGVITVASAEPAVARPLATAPEPEEPETFPRNPELESKLDSQRSRVPARLRRSMLKASYNHLRAASWDMAIRDWAQEFWRARDKRGVTIPTGEETGEALTDYYPDVRTTDVITE